MEQRISLVTLGVADLARSRRFYEAIGWRGQEVEQTVFFQAGGVGIVLWPREKLAADAALVDTGGDGFGGVAFAHNVRSPAEVDDIMAAAASAGAVVTCPARPTSMADTPVTSQIRTGTFGRSPTTPASPSATMAG